MSRYIDIPLKSPNKRGLFISEFTRLQESEDGAVFIRDECGEEWMEADMSYNNIKKLLLSRTSVAVGRRKVPEQKVVSLIN